jgi:predicted transcriptional regulator
MKTIHLEVTEAEAREMLDKLELEHGEILLKVHALEERMNRIKKGLGITRESNIMPDGDRLTIEGPSKLKTPSGRIKKGQSERIILEFLAKRNGNGATIKEITSETGTVYGTVRRVLEKLKDKSIVNEDGGLWRKGESEFR